MIINCRYNREIIAGCGYPAIGEHLSMQPSDNLGIVGARATHVWCDDPEQAERFAAAAYISNIVDSPENVVGQVDAVVIATDIGAEHVERYRPFITAGGRDPSSDGFGDIEDLNTVMGKWNAGTSIP